MRLVHDTGWLTQDLNNENYRFWRDRYYMLEKTYGVADSDVISLEQVREERKKFPLKVAGTDPPASDWLSKMKSGTEFVVQEKSGMHMPRWVGIEWTHGGLHHTGNILLIPTKSQNDVKTWIWCCDPIEFCRTFTLKGIIEEPEE